MLKYRPNLLRGMPKYQFDASGLDDEDISLTKIVKSKSALNAMATCLSLTAQSRTSPLLLKSFGFSMGLSYDGWDCEGTHEQLVDYCLLRLRNDGTNEVYRARTRKVLSKVAGAEKTDKALMQERLRQGSFKDEGAWIASCMKSECPEVALQAISTALNDKRTRATACSLIADRTVRGDVRAAAITLLSRSRQKTVLLALCDALEDSTPANKREYAAMFRADYPFSDRIVVKIVRPIVEKQMKPDLSKTIGDLAYAGLKKAAKKDFGTDAQPWREWVLKNGSGN
jgi:hypothetical protein